jgi:phytoene desaturase
VALPDGSELPFDLVASNGDVVTPTTSTAGRPARPGRGQGGEAQALLHVLFVIYFGLKRKHPQLEHHTVIFGPRYKELIGEIFKGPELAQDFSLYLHAPTRTDPSLAPEGCEAFYVLSPVPHLGAAPDLDWENGGVEVPRPHPRISGGPLHPGAA